MSEEAELAPSWAAGIVRDGDGKDERNGSNPKSRLTIMN
jgi:hypothetical protein